MNFFTHLFISKALHQRFSKELKLNKRAFAYGNIKPDIPSVNHCHHTLEKCLFITLNLANQLTEEDLTEKQLSIKLGEISHYVCDFFCYYHLNENLHNKKRMHFLYEHRLHREIINLNQIYSVLPDKREPRKDISLLILEMRKEYLSQPHYIQKDIEYAMAAAVWVIESIIYKVKNSKTKIKEEKLIEDSINELKRLS